MYIPPFTVSAKAINLIAEISAKIERYAIRLEQSDGLRLRKANRIKTIHCSLAIEGNTLTEGEVSDIINGKNVVAPLRQVQEVKNAIQTYELYESLDPYSVDDLLKAHGVMMKALTEDTGNFRHGGVGVYADKQLIHMAPPAERVPYLVKDLFEWLRVSQDHLLIKSCVFHYEFEFIHPFSDGNGRTGRLWQSLILGKLHPLFEHLPVENMVYANQGAYYDAIQRSNDAAQSGPFIEFMLQEILNALTAHQGEPLVEVPNKLPNKFPNKLPNKLQEVLGMIEEEPKVSAATVALELQVSERMARNYFAQLKELGYIERRGSNKSGFWKILKDNI